MMARPIGRAHTPAGAAERKMKAEDGESARRGRQQSHGHTYTHTQTRTLLCTVSRHPCDTLVQHKGHAVVIPTH